IRDAMIAGQIDVGSGGFPPFALAIDKGLDWKAVGALNEMPLFLNCARAGIRSLKDLKPDDRIALPAIGSVQHIILQMETEKELGDPRKLDRQVVAMAHEDATAALLSHREITCHLSGPPYQYEQLRSPGIGSMPMQLPAEALELPRAQVGRLEQVRFFPGAHRVEHLPLAIVVQPLEEQGGKAAAAARDGHLSTSGAALEGPLERFEHALEAVQRARQRLALALRQLQARDRERRLR